MVALVFLDMEVVKLMNLLGLFDHPGMIWRTSSIRVT